MEVIRARVLGFCMGVRRAVEITGDSIESLASAEAQAAFNADGTTKVYTLGPLIHNPEVLSDLKRCGVEILEPEIDALADDLSGRTIIIRAHGVSPEIEAELIRRGAVVIDATCPHVKANQMKARALSEEGFAIFLAGERSHAEISGIRSYIKGDCFIVSDPKEAEAAAEELARKKPNAKTALLGQTTLSPEEYRCIGEAIKRHFPNLETSNTICGATKERQDALRQLSGRVEAFVIAGGRDSANTRRLLSIAENPDEMSGGKKTWLVENAAGLPPEVFDYSVIGLAAGASTPDETIDEIEKALLGEP